MRDEPEIKDSPDTTPHERFTDLGRKVLTVPKSEVDKREAEWKRKRSTPVRKKRIR